MRGISLSFLQHGSVCWRILSLHRAVTEDLRSTWRRIQTPPCSVSTVCFVFERHWHNAHEAKATCFYLFWHVSCWKTSFFCSCEALIHVLALQLSRQLTWVTSRNGTHWTPRSLSLPSNCFSSTGFYTQSSIGTSTGSLCQAASSPWQSLPRKPQPPQTSRLAVCVPSSLWVAWILSLGGVFSPSFCINRFCLHSIIYPLHWRMGRERWLECRVQGFSLFPPHHFLYYDVNEYNFLAGGYIYIYINGTNAVSKHWLAEERSLLHDAQRTLKKTGWFPTTVCIVQKHKCWPDLLFCHILEGWVSQISELDIEQEQWLFILNLSLHITLGPDQILETSTAFFIQETLPMYREPIAMCRSKCRIVMHGNTQMAKPWHFLQKRFGCFIPEKIFWLALVLAVFNF